MSREVRRGSRVGVLVAALLVLAVFTTSGVAATGADAPPDPQLRINHLQSMGSHNSYRLVSRWPLPVLVSLWDYGHAPLDVQLDLEGVRKLELDLYVGQGGDLEVFHVPEIDDRTSCRRFLDCLRSIRSWSVANPTHSPVFVMIEPKDDLSVLNVSERWDEFEAAVRSVFPPEALITPDDVRGAHGSVAEGIAADGWPALDWGRGRALFFLNASGEARDRYLAGHEDLAGRVAFPEGVEGEPWAAVFVVNDPVVGADRIRRLVEDGFIVRTRADDEVRLAPAMAQAALDSGAHVISTDFPSPGHTADGDGSFTIPGGVPSRCNPVSAPPACTAEAIESGVWTHRPQLLQVEYGGVLYEATLASGTFVVGPPGPEPARQVTGTAELSGVPGGAARFSIQARQFLGLPVYTGAVTLDDPARGVALSAPLPFARIGREGVNGASGSVDVLDTSTIPWTSSRLRWHIETQES